MSVAYFNPHGKFESGVLQNTEGKKEKVALKVEMRFSIKQVSPSKERERRRERKPLQYPKP